MRPSFSRIFGNAAGTPGVDRRGFGGRGSRVFGLLLAAAACLAAGCGTEPMKTYQIAGHGVAAGEKILVLPFMDARTFTDPNDPYRYTLGNHARDLFAGAIRENPILKNAEILTPPINRPAGSLTLDQIASMGREHGASLVAAGQIFSYTETRAASIPPRAGMFIRIVSAKDGSLVFVGDHYQAAMIPGAPGGRELQAKNVCAMLLESFASNLEEVLAGLADPAWPDSALAMLAPWAGKDPVSGEEGGDQEQPDEIPEELPPPPEALSPEGGAEDEAAEPPPAGDGEEAPEDGSSENEKPAEDAEETEVEAAAPPADDEKPETEDPDGATAAAGTPEAGTPEAGTPEAGTPEAGTPEAETPEAETPEASAANVEEVRFEEGGEISVPPAGTEDAPSPVSPESGSGADEAGVSVPEAAETVPAAVDADPEERTVFIEQPIPVANAAEEFNTDPDAVLLSNSPSGSPWRTPAVAPGAKKVLMLPYHDRQNPNNIIPCTGGGEVVTSLFSFQLASGGDIQLLWSGFGQATHDTLLTRDEAIEQGRLAGADYVVRGQVVEFRRAQSVPSFYSVVISAAVLAAQLLFAEVSGVDVATEVYRVSDGMCVMSRRDVSQQKYVVQAEKTVRRLAAGMCGGVLDAIKSEDPVPMEPIIDTLEAPERWNPQKAM